MFSEDIKKQVSEDLRQKLYEASKDILKEEEDTLRMSLSTPYPPASIAGQPPHYRSGNLYRSVATDLELKGDGVVLTVSSDAEYALYLEEGTGKMMARPFLQPSQERLTAALEELLGD